MGVQIVTHFNAIGKAGNEQVQSTSISAAKAEPRISKFENLVPNETLTTVLTYVKSQPGVTTALVNKRCDSRS
jgi:hypothetical protein